MKHIARSVLCAGFALLLLGASPAQAAEERPLEMSPHMLVLNAVGQFDSVQGNFSIALPAGAITGFEFDIWFAGEWVEGAFDVEYCAIDDILHVFFDREALQASPVVQALVGQTVTVQVAGWLTIDGVPAAIEIFGYDTVQVVGPGKASPRR